ncbi:hypothetical protein QBC37DRAFT_407255 [Rhypophila decipiens]|uniref:Uncharacterized protein n=1 Tax=Rhypophila decipiens TaxID=261697 RepID=A0AAN6XST0_9PEZI|nr:hypothetical protein QBC37DRAFT_407255 [Rhypophila decipiens]
MYITLKLLEALLVIPLPAIVLRASIIVRWLELRSSSWPFSDEISSESAIYAPSFLPVYLIQHSELISITSTTRSRIIIVLCQHACRDLDAVRSYLGLGARIWPPCGVTPQNLEAETCQLRSWPKDTVPKPKRQRGVSLITRTISHGREVYHPYSSPHKQYRFDVRQQ